MAFTKGHNLSKGRPVGSLNKAPNKEKLIQLIDRLTDSISNEFDNLSIKEKIHLLSSFKNLYNIEEVSNNTEIRPVIINLGSGINPNKENDINK